MNEYLLGPQQAKVTADFRAASMTMPAPPPTTADSVIARLADLDEQVGICHALAARIEEDIAGANPTDASGGSRPDPRGLGVNGLTLNLREAVGRLRSRLEVIASSLG